MCHALPPSRARPERVISGPSSCAKALAKTWDKSASLEERQSPATGDWVSQDLSHTPSMLQMAACTISLRHLYMQGHGRPISNGMLL